MILNESVDLTFVRFDHMLSLHVRFGPFSKRIDSFAELENKSPIVELIQLVIDMFDLKLVVSMFDNQLTIDSLDEVHDFKFDGKIMLISDENLIPLSGCNSFKSYTEDYAMGGWYVSKIVFSTIFIPHTLDTNGYISLESEIEGMLNLFSSMKNNRSAYNCNVCLYTTLHTKQHLQGDSK
jgi:hypothetical protein